jgi:hypothetical protein
LCHIISSAADKQDTKETLCRNYRENSQQNKTAVSKDHSSPEEGDTVIIVIVVFSSITFRIYILIYFMALGTKKKFITIYFAFHLSSLFV